MKIDREKIKKFMKEHREVLLLATAAGLLIIVVTYAYIQNKVKEDQYYPSLLGEEEAASGSLDNLTINSDVSGNKVLSLPVYTAKQMSSEKIEVLAETFGFNEFHETGSDDGTFRIWIRGSDFLRYNTETYDLTLNSAPIRLKEIERGYITLGNVEEYFREFVSEYLGIEQEYWLSSSRLTKGYSVNGTALLENYEVVKGFGQDYAIAAEFTEGGDLTALYLSTVLLEKNDENVEIVSVNSLKQYLATGSYPQESYLSIQSDSDTGCEGCDAYGFYTPDDFETGTISDARIVYYYDLAKSDSVLPVYKLTGNGVVSNLSGKRDDVTVTIYANAVDPSKIVLPDEEE